MMGATAREPFEHDRDVMHRLAAMRRKFVNSGFWYPRSPAVMPGRPVGTVGWVPTDARRSPRPGLG